MKQLPPVRMLVPDTTEAENIIECVDWTVELQLRDLINISVEISTMKEPKCWVG